MGSGESAWDMAEWKFVFEEGSGEPIKVVFARDGEEVVSYDLPNRVQNELKWDTLTLARFKFMMTEVTGHDLDPAATSRLLNQLGRTVSNPPLTTLYDINITREGRHWYPFVNIVPGLVGAHVTGSSSFPVDTVDEAVASIRKELALFQEGDTIRVRRTGTVHHTVDDAIADLLEALGRDGIGSR